MNTNIGQKLRPWQPHSQNHPKHPRILAIGENAPQSVEAPQTLLTRTYLRFKVGIAR